jgi:Flp pilus assembly protein TadG
MIARKEHISQLVADNRGSATIETAFVIPVLAIMVFGGFEVSSIVSRQTELQTAAAEATAVVLARAPKDASDRATLEQIIETSAGLPANKVSLSLKYRCDVEEDLEDNATSCSTTAVVSEFVVITMEDTYTPVWTEFGVGQPINFNVTRRVQIS